MSDDQALHPGHRSVRLQGYDYSTSGLYFVTVCAEKKKSIMGRIEREKFQPSRLGWIIHQTWIAPSRHYALVNLLAFVVMPNPR
jgi:putative transposase